jgi:hypothetical protein
LSTVLLGAELNAEMEHQAARDTTEGMPKPLSSDSVASQRMAMSFAIEFHGGLVNGGIEAFRPCEGLVSKMMLL